MVKNLNKTDTIHIFTLKTLILFLISTLLLKKQTYTIASITGLGYLFSKTRIAQILRIIIRPVIKTEKVFLFCLKAHKTKNITKKNVSKLQNKSNWGFVFIIVFAKKIIIKKNKKLEAKK